MLAILMNISVILWEALFKKKKKHNEENTRK